jgi:hypothetical protein
MKKLAILLMLVAGSASAETQWVVNCAKTADYLVQLEKLLKETPEPSMLNTFFGRVSMETQERIYRDRVTDIKSKIWKVRYQCPRY